MKIYYVDLKNKVAITDKPVNESEFVKINLPDNKGWLKVAGKGKEYPDYKVAMAVVAGQIKIEDVEA